MTAIRIALVGDNDAQVLAHRAIPRALELAFAERGLAGGFEWVHTASIGARAADRLAGFAGVWCVPATPYADTAAALDAIGFARRAGRPFLGTCGGFQHALLEYAAAAWGIANPAHAELDPAAPQPVIAPLACALVEQRGAVRFAGGSRLAASYGALASDEGYHCRYGLHPAFARRLDDGPLRATAWDDSGDVRGVELDGHPFFVATLFQPERHALTNQVPPIVRAFVAACVTNLATP